MRTFYLTKIPNENIWQVMCGHPNRDGVWIATCTKETWALAIVNALNQMEIES